MWIPLLVSLVTTTPAPAPTARPEAIAKADAGPFEALSEPALRGALAAMGESVPLTPKAAQVVDAVVAALRAGDEAGARKAWRRVIERQHPEGRRAEDVPALVGMVLCRAYLEDTATLAAHAEKVAFYNELKRDVREALQATRDAVAKVEASGAKLVEVPALLVRTEFVAGHGAVLLRNTIDTVSVGEAHARIAKYEEILASVGDDAQLANIDLQNALQKQQQVLQMMSNISKMLHDTAMAVIRKIGG